MKSNDKFEHPELIELLNICSISPDAKGAREVCDMMLASKATTSKRKKSRKKG